MRLGLGGIGGRGGGGGISMCYIYILYRYPYTPGLCDHFHVLKFRSTLPLLETLPIYPICPEILEIPFGHV